MKIHCDVCNKDEASVFCSADDAALCDACDHRVHHANKLAGKHLRFSLLHPSAKQFPLCDICQEKRAFLFCQQDRAILCGDCDLPIHKANEHTQKHSRFLLTGVKLSATSALYSPRTSSTTDGRCGIGVPNLKYCNSIDRPIVAAKNAKTATVVATTTSDEGSGSTATASSISEYLIEMLPGWRVEDFLELSPPTFGFSKCVDVLPNWDGDLETNLSSSSFPKHVGNWIPQAPPPPPEPLHPFQYPSSSIDFAGQMGFKESKEGAANKSGRKWGDDDVFAVPQINGLPSSTAFKRSRTVW
ncbi:hypothetical protein U1Q18_016110 [Sarracenia purpurea var. burkii]